MLILTWKPVVRLALMTIASMLTACAGSTGSVKPDLRPVPAYLADPCANPTKLPAKPLSRKDVERYWRIDRASLVSCKDKHTGVVNYYRRRDNRLVGGK